MEQNELRKLLSSTSQVGGDTEEIRWKARTWHSNKLACAGFDDISEFYRIKEAMIAREYNVDEIQMRILNGDGESWIKHGIDDTVHYQLDPFHKHKAILHSVREDEQRKVILKLLGGNEIKAMLEYIAGLINDTEDEKEQKKLKDLYSYFKENREGLIPY